jgi:hypothetical protein
LCYETGLHRWLLAADNVQGFMFWWYERRGKFTRVEVRELPAGAYELRILPPDGAEQIEHIACYEELVDRYAFVRAQLQDTEWHGPTPGPT